MRAAFGMLIARGFFSTINVWLLSIPRVHEGDFFVFSCITKHFNELKCVRANCKLHKSPPFFFPTFIRYVSVWFH